MLPFLYSVFPEPVCFSELFLLLKFIIKVIQWSLMHFKNRYIYFCTLNSIFFKYSSKISRLNRRFSLWQLAPGVDPWLYHLFLGYNGGNVDGWRVENMGIYHAFQVIMKGEKSWLTLSFNFNICAFNDGLCMFSIFCAL